MADEADEQEGSEDSRVQLVQQYCLKTIKQVGSLVITISCTSIEIECTFLVCMRLEK